MAYFTRRCFQRYSIVPGVAGFFDDSFVSVVMGLWWCLSQLATARKRIQSDQIALGTEGLRCPPVLCCSLAWRNPPNICLIVTRYRLPNSCCLPGFCQLSSQSFV